MLDKIKLCFFVLFNSSNIQGCCGEDTLGFVKAWSFFFKISRQVVETAVGADLRIKSLKGRGGGRGDYGLTRLFVKDAQIGCATNNSMH